MQVQLRRSERRRGGGGGSAKEGRAVGQVVVAAVVAVVRGQGGIGFQATSPVSFKTSFWNFVRLRCVFVSFRFPGELPPLISLHGLLM